MMPATSGPGRIGVLSIPELMAAIAIAIAIALTKYEVALNSTGVLQTWQELKAHHVHIEFCPVGVACTD